MDENTKNIIKLTDESGHSIDYELLDIIKFDEKIYTVFYPTAENDTEVVILRVENTGNVDESRYVVEEDPYILKKVYEMFKEKYKDEIKFED